MLRSVSWNRYVHQGSRTRIIKSQGQIMEGVILDIGSLTAFNACVLPPGIQLPSFSSACTGSASVFAKKSCGSYHTNLSDRSARCQGWEKRHCNNSTEKHSAQSQYGDFAARLLWQSLTPRESGTFTLLRLLKTATNLFGLHPFAAIKEFDFI